MYKSLPVNIDFFAFFIFLGAIQGFYLSYFFLTHSKGNNFANRFLGFLLLSLSLVISDVWLGYTNYMFRILWLVDFTEPLNFTFCPLFYLYIKTRITNKFSKNQWFHFAPAIIYLIYMAVLLSPQSEAYKYNAYINAFHPSFKEINCDVIGLPWMFWLQDNIRELTFIQMVIYSVWNYITLKKEFKNKNLSYFSNNDINLVWLRNVNFQLLSLIFVFFTICMLFPHDLGDHIIAAHIALVIYIISFSIMRKSIFFHQINEKILPQKKYEKSSLSSEMEEHILKKLIDFMETEKSFQNSSFSLPELAKTLSVSPHHLSQILNENLGKNFFEFIAEYRIKEAKKILSSKENNHLKIEEVAEKVGYNSKSSFNTSFKKITGTTPSEFKKAY